MISQFDPEVSPASADCAGERSRGISQLIAEVYQSAPAALRMQLIERLMQPLGLLALVTVAQGVFARIWFRRGWQDLSLRLEDMRMVSPRDVVALAEFVEKVSLETVNGLANMLSSWPVFTGSAAVALLIAALARRAALRGTGSEQPEAERGQPG
jgi:hypothetical protein